MICSRCHQQHNRTGQRYCSACHAEAQRAHRRRVKQAASPDFGFIPRETESDEEDVYLACAVSSLEGWGAR